MVLFQSLDITVEHDSIRYYKHCINAEIVKFNLLRILNQSNKIDVQLLKPYWVFYVWVKQGNRV